MKKEKEMTKLEIERFMKELEKKMGAYTQENLLQYDKVSQLWYLRTFFPFILTMA